MEKKTRQNISDLIISQSKQYFAACNWQHHKAFIVQWYNTLDKIGNVCITWHCGVSVRPLLQWKIITYYIFSVCVCSLRYPVCYVHVPYCHL